jgi:hypothetical protein
MARFAIVKSFYGSIKWIKFRIAIIIERGLICEECHKIIANEKEAEVDHTIELTPDNIHDVNITLNPDNVKVKCHQCHDKRHHRFGNNTKEVFIVYGCPGSGKEEYVRHNQGRTDIVICMDSLFEAITGLPRYDKPDGLLFNVKSVYNLLIDQVKTRYGKWSTAWVIGGYADKYKREKLADDLGAELIYCECSKEEAIARIEQDPRRCNMLAEYKKYINEWFERYVE